MASRLLKILFGLSALLALPATGSAAFITFGTGADSNLVAGTPLTEAGFTYRATVGNGFELQSDRGNPDRALATFFNDEFSTVGDRVDFTRAGGGLFTFASTDTALVLDNV